jgi:hypothetical protein
MICDCCGRDAGTLSLQLPRIRFTFLEAQLDHDYLPKSIVSTALSSAIFMSACSIQIAAQEEWHPGLANH